jgi:hypothetical protein
LTDNGRPLSDRRQLSDRANNGQSMMSLNSLKLPSPRTANGARPMTSSGVASSLFAVSGNIAENTSAHSLKMRYPSAKDFQPVPDTGPEEYLQSVQSRQMGRSFNGSSSGLFAGTRLSDDEMMKYTVPVKSMVRRVTCMPVVQGILLKSRMLM